MAPLQNAEVVVLRKQCMAFEVNNNFFLLYFNTYKMEWIAAHVPLSDSCVSKFQLKQRQFRDMFRATAPFSYKAVHPYISLEKV